MNCPECGFEMVKVYDVEEIEEEFKAKGITDFAAMKAQYDLLRNMTCPECGFTKQLSALEIMAEFVKIQKKEGKTEEETIKLVKLKIEEAKKEFKK